MIEEQNNNRIVSLNLIFAFFFLKLKETTIQTNCYVEMEAYLNS